MSVMDLGMMPLVNLLWLDFFSPFFWLLWQKKLFNTAVTPSDGKDKLNSQESVFQSAVESVA